MSLFYEENLDQSIAALELALDATAESIRANWLKQRLSNAGLDQLIPEAEA